MIWGGAGVIVYGTARINNRVALFLSYTGDKDWYRAVVERHNSQDTVTVKYIDFGNSEERPLSELRPFKEEFLQIPALACRCSLAGQFCTQAKLVIE